MSIPQSNHDRLEIERAVREREARQLTLLRDLLAPANVESPDTLERALYKFWQILQELHVTDDDWISEFSGTANDLDLNVFVFWPDEAPWPADKKQAVGELVEKLRLLVDGKLAQYLETSK